MTEKIQTLHPDPDKAGVNIDLAKYEQIRANILAVLADGDTGFSDLVGILEDRLGDSFEGSIPWYTVSVKLDLEARGLIARVPKSSPQILRVRIGAG